MTYYRWRRRTTRTYRPDRWWLAVALPVAVLAFTAIRLLLSKR